ncbi:MAG: general secretion pathway protein GspK [Thermoguttaceae bacterium]
MIQLIACKSRKGSASKHNPRGSRFARPTLLFDVRTRGRRRGMILVVVLVVIAMLSLAALTFGQMMLVERRAANLSARMVQARTLTDSGVDLIRVFASQEQETLDDAGGIYNNTAQFQGVLVVPGEKPHDRGRFAVVSPALDGQGNYAGIRFGLEDESAKINLNALVQLDEQNPSENIGRQILMGLPGMTENIADSILDWIDMDDEPREYGAESDYYNGLSPPYSPKNGPLESIEELLLVEGMTPQLLFGVDANRNNQVDSEEPDPSTVGTGIADGSMTRGWSAYLTLWSMEANVNPSTGSPRVNLNQTDMQQLYTQLSTALDEPTAAFIVAYCQYGPTPTPPPGTPTPAGQKTVPSITSSDLDLTRPGKTQLKSVLDLVGAQVSINGKDGNAVLVQTPFPNTTMGMSTYLPNLMDNLTVQTASTIPGRININQATNAVLTGIPGMTSDIIQQIIAQQEPDPSQADPSRRYATWLLTEGIVTLAQMKALEPYICGGGNVFKAQIVGYFDQDGPDARVEAVFDASQQPAQVIFWRDISHLGRGYPRESLGIEASQ